MEVRSPGRTQKHWGRGRLARGMSGCAGIPACCKGESENITETYNPYKLYHVFGHELMTNYTIIIC